MVCTIGGEEPQRIGGAHGRYEDIDAFHRSRADIAVVAQRSRDHLYREVVFDEDRELRVDLTGDRPQCPNVQLALEDLVNQMDYVCQMAGDALHAGIGGDTDGQGGRECAPADVDTVYDYLKIADILRARGYAEPDVENVMWRNWVRRFTRALPA